MRISSFQRTALMSWIIAGAAATGCGDTYTKHGSGSTPPPADQPDQSNQQGVVTSNRTLIQGANGNSIKIPEGDARLAFDVDGPDIESGALKVKGYECRIGAEGKFFGCDGSAFVLTGLKANQNYNLTVRGLLEPKDAPTTPPAGAADAPTVAQDATVDIEVSEPETSSGETASPPGSEQSTGSSLLSHSLQVGGAYLLSVPEHMHVTEYSTSKTTGVLSVFRILPESDPNYLGNFECNESWDRKLVGISPSGTAFNYCHSTPTRGSFTRSNETRLANNHVEIATDPLEVTTENFERISVSIFDSDYEYVTPRSRFVNLCQDRRKSYIDVPMLNNFFLGRNPEQVRFWFCDTVVPGADGSPEIWKVGMFNDVDSYDYNCRSCNYTRAIEMVYMSRPNSENLLPEYFARSAQTRILKVLNKVLP